MAAALLAALAAAPEGFAHAVLVATDPQDDAVVLRTPARVSLRFDEHVETAFGSVRIYDGEAHRVDSGRIERPAADTVVLEVGRTLPPGTYTVAWRAVSADTHPVHGAFVFSIGAPSPDRRAVAERVLREEATPRAISAGFTAVRFASLALLLLAAGGAVWLAVAWRDCEPRVRQKLAGLLAAAAGALVPVSLAGLVFEGASAGGFGLVDAARPSVVSAVLDTRFGHWWLLRGMLALLLALAALAAARSRVRGRPAAGVALALATGLLVTATAAAHASTAGPAAMVADLAHLGGAAVWTGGLVFLTATLAFSGDRWRTAARLVPRFSTLALGAVAVLLAAGAVGGYLEIRTWRGLSETTYGRLVLAKLALVVPLLGLGAYNNRVAVPRLRVGAGAVDRRRFLRATAAELALVVAIVAVTAVLVGEPPARSQVVPHGPFAASTPIGPFELDLVVDPARAGPNTVHLYLLDRSGRPAEVAAASVSATYPAERIGPLRLDARRAGPGHFVVPAAKLAIAGAWQLGVQVRRGEFDEWSASVPISIRRRSP